MKAMKYVGLATLAAVTLGFATPTFADEEGFDTDVTVEVKESYTFTLEAVPSAYDFSTLVLNGGVYTGLEATISDDNMVKVFKGYEDGLGAGIEATFNGLTVTRDGDEVEDAVEVTAFSIGETSLMDTGETKTLFEDSEFVKNAAGEYQATGNLAKTITGVTLGFKGDVLPGDAISGIVMYSANDVPN